MPMHLIKDNKYGGYLSRHDGDLLRDKINRICNLLEKIKLAEDAAIKNPDFERLHTLHMFKLDLSTCYLELVSMLNEILL